METKLTTRTQFLSSLPRAISKAAVSLIFTFLAVTNVVAGSVPCTVVAPYTSCTRITSSGADQTYAIPNPVNTVDVSVWGAAGGGANSAWYTVQGGGAGGGFASATAAVTPGGTLTVVVGKGGIPNSQVTTYGGGGAGGIGSGATSHGGSGGGMSAIFSSSTKTVASALVIGGGGGGGSPGADGNSQGAGGGGGSTGNQDAVPASSGRGGTQIAGGAAAVGPSACSLVPQAGAQFQGGYGGNTSTTLAHEGGGGGGGGWFGGGGGLCQNNGGANNTQNGGGGGGSSYTSGTGVTAGATTAGGNFLTTTGACAGNANSGGAGNALYTAGIGQGSCYGTGGDGEVVIRYKNPVLRIQKISNGAVGTYTFSGSTNLLTTPAAITTITAGVAAPVTPTEITILALATPVTITETIPPTFTMTANCTDSNSATTGNTGNFGTIAGGVLTIAAARIVTSANITCVFTNTKIPAFVTIQKTTLGGFGGPFSFTATNLSSTLGNVTTTAANTPVAAAPANINITAIGTAVTVTETPAAGYVMTSFSCTDANSAVTGNPATFGTFAGNIATIPAANIVSGGSFTCTITNTRSTIIVQKISNAGVGTFAFNVTNMAALASIPTTTAGVAAPASPTALNITTIGTAITINETPMPAGFRLTAINCTDANNAVTGNTGIFATFSGSVVTIPAVNVKAGSAFTCTLTNTRAAVRVQKTTSGGFGGPFNFTVTNLAATPSAITTTVAATPTPPAPAAIAISATGTAVTLTEPATAGFFISSASCTDANSALTGNTGTIGTLVGATLTIPVANSVAGADFTCVFNNIKGAPQLTIVKAANSPGPFSAGQVVTYTYTVTNSGNVAMAAVTVSDIHNGSGAFVGPGNETLFTDAAPTGDTMDATVNASWDILGPNDAIKFTATYTVTQSDVDTLQ